MDLIDPNRRGGCVSTIEKIADRLRPKTVELPPRSKVCADAESSTRRRDGRPIVEIRAVVKTRIAPRNSYSAIFAFPISQPGKCVGAHRVFRCSNQPRQLAPLRRLRLPRWCGGREGAIWHVSGIRSISRLRRGWNFTRLAYRAAKSTIAFRTPAYR